MKRCPHHNIPGTCPVTPDRCAPIGFIGSLRKLLGLCQHKWKVLKHEPILRTFDNANIGDIFTMQCEHCGHIKGMRVKI